MINDYEKNQDNSIENREIFKIIDELIYISLLNLPPTNREHSQWNKQELHLAILRDYNMFKKDEDNM
ncbi:hypothetical protein [uncultured Methanobrevibacter sp.]|uniref:hypothetical protein n=1 Tax=uncultured Methanobrevibacter sp. TaxID=253161 RepID=UPI0025D7B620|nr:hypothetical protein [uncultured Methanobrevibacter sp.]